MALFCPVAVGIAGPADRKVLARAVSGRGQWRDKRPLLVVKYDLARGSFHTTHQGAAWRAWLAGCEGVFLVGLHTYEITFTGRAGSTLHAEFDDCEVLVGPATTTLHAEVPDQAALWGIVQRIIGLGLEVTNVNLVAPSPPPAGETSANGDQSGDRQAADADLT